MPSTSPSSAPASSARRSRASSSQYRLRCLLLDAAERRRQRAPARPTPRSCTRASTPSPARSKSRLVRRGHALLTAYGPRRGHSDRAHRRAAGRVGRRAARRPAGHRRERGAQRLRRGRPVSAAELYRREPHLGPGALGALRIPDESLICPFTTPAGVRHTGGAQRRRAAPRRARSLPSMRERRRRPRAGHAARDACAPAMSSTPPASTRTRSTGCSATRAFTVTPRRGELIVFDKLARLAASATSSCRCPTKVTKGVLVSPTVFGNVVLGPTAEDIADKTRHRLDRRRPGQPAREGPPHPAGAAARRRSPPCTSACAPPPSTATTRSPFHPEQRYVCVGGIRSTGLSASMAIAEHVVEGLRDAGLALERKDATSAACACRTSARRYRARISAPS